MRLGDGIGSSLTNLEEITIPVTGRFDDSFLSTVVDMDNTETLDESFTPLEVV